MAYVFVEEVKVLLELLRGERAGRIVAGVVVDVGHEHGGRKVGSIVFAAALVAVSARANFKVEAAVELVLFRAVQRRQQCCHFGAVKS
jgi:hypothetical protein